MGVLRSKLGWAFVVLYVVGFITVYYRVRPHQGTFVYDLGLDLLALPTFWWWDGCSCSSRPSRYHAHEPWGLVPAVVFCSGLLLLAGAGLERAGRAVSRRVRSRRAGSKP